MASGLKHRVALALEGEDPRYGKLPLAGLHMAIVLSAFTITLQSMPGHSTDMQKILLGLEAVLLAIFVTEFCLRFWSAENRLGYIFSFWGLIDLLSILPALLFLLPDSTVLRTLRLMRIFRLLKLLRMRRAILRLEHAISSNREEMLLFGVLAAIVLFLAAVGIYHFEKDAQPEIFGSIPQSAWWAIATLTTVGYGDVYPVTTGGRVFTAITLLIGLGIVAIPAGLITSGLLNAPEEETETETTTNGE
ncbi:ion transporter [uncultured Pelagimonas sp.]|uniref:ion transporter n=1 Tax=uncultured Pelagimonas sp. TaxID=1618102 RepID=UPI00262B5BD1|nr:ion transporter [uncultured Pelagimonas sp.]